MTESTTTDSSDENRGYRSIGLLWSALKNKHGFFTCHFANHIDCSIRNCGGLRSEYDGIHRDDGNHETSRTDYPQPLNISFHALLTVAQEKGFPERNWRVCELIDSIPLL